MKKLKNKIRNFLGIRNIIKIDDNLKRVKKIEIDEYISKNLYNNSKYDAPSYLNKKEFQVFSQNGEDGIIQEIFDRIGTTNKFFVEFGTETGVETNSCLLLVKGWKGLWIEASDKMYNQLKIDFREQIKSSQLQAFKEFVTKDNIEALLDKAKTPIELDLLSIDIDGNDYWVWKNVVKYKPRVVVIEYNGAFVPPIEWIMKYNPNHWWKGDSYFGASLESINKLANSKGYKLVGCCFHGVNAFFVREDLIEDKFTGPFTSEHYFEPHRTYLNNKSSHPRKFGPFITE